EKDSVSMRVIADHCRAVTFLICDGALPSNEGRGYVLRRIMRRAARHAKMLGVAEPLLCKMVDAVREMMGNAYPELAEREAYIRKVVLAEEERFNETLDRGLAILNEEVANLRASGSSVIPGETLFKLYDTFGFPVDLTEDIVRAEGFSVDEPGFEACMEHQRELGREHWKGSGAAGIADVYKELHNHGLRTNFVGYGSLTAFSPVTALLRNGSKVQSATAGDKIDLICETSPFYGESGGQAGDTGSISSGSAHLEVLATSRPFTDLLVHHVLVKEGAIKTGDAVNLTVDSAERRATARNHSATHLLQAALRKVLGEHIKQAGSLVEPDRLRFDFTHFTGMTSDELQQVEDLVNAWIMDNAELNIREMGMQEAVESGATALFDEKYGSTVRVVRIGEVSAELCGGTHVRAAGDIGLFKILSEGGIAAGVRRIEGATGFNALHFVRRLEGERQTVAELLKSDSSKLVDRVEKLMERQRELQREVEALQGKLNASQSVALHSLAQEVAGVTLLSAQVEVPDIKALRDMADQLRDKLGSGVVALGAELDGKANLLVTVTKDLTDRFKAGELVAKLAPIVGGRGGGKPELAQAGGSQPEKLAEALAAVAKLMG
ncbi:MAG: alanine--tRNA ligase, partial [Geobacteraceae bacterium]|nr:alanine--tRNA ligase [Geobacteraceae bacterium]